MFLIFLLVFVFILCINELVKKVKIIKFNGDYKIGIIIIIERGKREKIVLENIIFKKLGLFLFYNIFGVVILYLVFVNDNYKESFGVFEEYNEDKVFKYFKNLSLRGYGDNLFYWRWKISIKKFDLYSKVGSRLIVIYKNNFRNVLIFVNGEW